MLIAPGGRTAYIGPCALVQSYFEGLGHVFEPKANPADILMDILSTDATLADKWAAKMANEPVTKEQVLASKENLFFQNIEQISKQRGAYWFLQVYYCFARYLNQQLRHIVSLVLEVFVGLFAGLLMGISVNGQNGQLYTGMYVKPYTLVSPSPVDWLVPLYGLLIGFAVALAGSPAGVKVFGEEKTIFWRETAAGHSPSAYYIGKTIAAIPRIFLSAFHFAAIYQFLALPTFPNFSTVFAIILGTFQGIYGMSAFVSALVSRENGNIASIILAIFAAVFCGKFP